MTLRIPVWCAVRKLQLYVGFGDQRFGKDQREETVKQLKGFGKYYLNPSETVRATFV